MSDRQTGSVKWFNVEKGYGFRGVNEGRSVEFSVAESKRSLIAHKVATLA